jgi:DUF177 domain-containing protein
VSPRHEATESPLILRAGVLQRYLSSRETYTAETYLSDVRVVDTCIDSKEPIVFRGTLAPIHNGVVVSGELTATWAAECRRCNAAVSQQIQWDFSELFATEPTEGESYPLGDESIDLQAMVRDQAILQLPLAPVCRDDCAGICSNCGVDRNSESCSCGAGATDPRWDVLNDLNLGS